MEINRRNYFGSGLRIIHVPSSSCKVPVILVRFWWNLNILITVSKKYSNIKFHENPSSGHRLVPCGRTDMTKLIVALRDFAKAAYKSNITTTLQVFLVSLTVLLLTIKFTWITASFLGSCQYLYLEMRFMFGEWTATALSKPWIHNYCELHEM